MSLGAALPLRSTMRREAAFKAAWRHTRWVKFLRIAIPVLALLGSLGPVLFVFFEPLKTLPADIDVGSLNLDGSKITMDRANLKGFKDGDLPFTITADQAIQDVSTPYIVDLNGLKADVTMPDRSLAKITADHGVYDSQKDMLTARGNVDIKSPRYLITMRSGVIDFKTNRVTSKEPVTVTMKGGTIDADSMNVFDNGDRVQFGGRVRSVFRRAGAPEGNGN
ncbi:MAG: LPS export ABC transporter periplasmic protein LptC [Alphaproteobacteria bacterium]|nr:LPS export ABC transporter periplasmic protein LptC [Alphaproteobacteria bacterium]